MSNETETGFVEGRRKGRGQRVCKVSVNLTDEPDQIVLRTTDVSGVAPIVIVLGKAEAARLATLLHKAAVS
jgi:hypothetical protein